MMDFLIDSVPTGIIVFNEKTEIIFSNRRGKKFMDRHKLPGEVADISRRVFHAISESRLKEFFPGDIYLYKKLKDSPSSWTFKFYIYKETPPFVCVFITEDFFSNKIDINKTRDKYRLTRRETDVLRHVLNGLENIHIAEELEIAEQTVKDHLSNVYMKIGVRNRFDLVSSLVNFGGDIPSPT